MLEIIKTTLKGMVIVLMVLVTLSIPIAILTYLLNSGNGVYVALFAFIAMTLFMCYKIGTDFQEEEESRSIRPPKRHSTRPPK